MVLLNNNEDFSASSGVLNLPFLENIYHSIMDETYAANGLARTVTLHLHPIREQDDTNTQSLPQAQQYNPFFGRVPAPRANTRNAGVKITTQEVPYEAQVVFGPIKKDEDIHGIGELKEDEAAITLAIESLPHLNDTIWVDVEGLSYSIQGRKPIGFTRRRYVIVYLREINEEQEPSTDTTRG